MRLVRAAIVLAGIAVVTLVGGCPPAPPQNQITASSLVNVAPTIDARLVAAARTPRGFAFAPDGRLFFGEKETGLIRVVVGGQVLDAPFAAVPVNFAGDRGLLSLAIHPDFANNQRLYVCYSRSDTGASTDDPNAIVDNRVVYFEAAGNQAAGSEIFVASLPIGASAQRVGGRIAIDESWFLWVALGDLGTPADAQDPASLAGKVLRLNDDGSIPGDNPDAANAVVALGIRHPRGMAIDPVTGSPFLIDENEAGFHEVDRVQLDRNYGWPLTIGFASAPNELAFAASIGNYADPVVELGADVRAVTGGAFNPAGAFGPRRQNQFYFGDATQMRVYVTGMNGDRTAGTIDRFAGPFPANVTELGFSPTGVLYVGTQAAIYRVLPRAWDS